MNVWMFRQALEPENGHQRITCRQNQINGTRIPSTRNEKIYSVHYDQGKMRLITTHIQIFAKKTVILATTRPTFNWAELLPSANASPHSLFTPPYNPSPPPQKKKQRWKSVIQETTPWVCKTTASLLSEIHVTVWTWRLLHCSSGVHWCEVHLTVTRARRDVVPRAPADGRGRVWAFLSTDKQCWGNKKQHCPPIEKVFLNKTWKCEVKNKKKCKIPFIQL